MNDVQKSEGRFSFVMRAKSFANAWRGMWVFVKTTHNAWVQLMILCVAIVLGVVCGITRVDWILLAIAAGFVLAAEAFNTAIEIDIDLTSPEYHPFARDTKDVAAGAVLISSITAAIIGVGIFAPHLLRLLP